MIGLFLQFELNKIGRFFRTKTLAKVITSFLFLSVFVFVAIGIYFFFISGFRYINVEVEEAIQLPITLFVYEMFLLVLSGVIIFSSVISSIFSLFKGENDNWIVRSPSYKTFPRIIFVKSVLTSAWPLFVMFLPAVLALTKIYHLGIVTIIIILLSVVLVLTILNAVTFLIVLMISVLYYKITEKVRVLAFTFKNFIVLLAVLALALLATIWKNARNINLVHLFKADNPDVTVGISDISSHFHFLPTHPFALLIIYLQSGQVALAMTQLLVLAVLTVVLVLLWWKVSHLFYPVWQKFQEGNAQMRVDGVSFSGKRKLYEFTGSSTVALFKKEMLVLGRNYKGILWFMFLALIWLAQIGINVVSHHNVVQHQFDITRQAVILEAIQYIIAIYFICAFTLRFVFPAFSVEKKTSWILASAPLNFSKIFFSKYVFYSLIFVIIGAVMSSISTGALQVSFTHALYSSILFMTSVIFIVTFGLALGAFFPSLDTDDPEIISTTMPGLFFTALALIFGALSDGVLYLTVTKSSLFPLCIFVSLTSIMVVFILIRISRLAKQRTF